MGAIASQITSLMIIYSIVYSDADQRKHQSSASLAFVRGIHWGLVNSLHKWPVTRKMFPFDDVIMFIMVIPILGRQHIHIESASGYEYRTFFMPPPLGDGGIIFSGCPSVCPSVRSLKYPLSTCTWVRWSIRPTVTVLQHGPPSVRLSVHQERFLGISQRWQWPEILHADVSWLPSEVISLWSPSVDLSNFGTNVT